MHIGKYGLTTNMQQLGCHPYSPELLLRLEYRLRARTAVSISASSAGTADCEPQPTPVLASPVIAAGCLPPLFDSLTPAINMSARCEAALRAVGCHRHCRMKIRSCKACHMVMIFMMMMLMIIIYLCTCICIYIPLSIYLRYYIYTYIYI